MRTISLIATILLISISTVQCGKGYHIYNLATDMIMETDIVFSNGYRTDIPLEEIGDHEPGTVQVAEIHSDRPRFSWMIHCDQTNVYQQKYRIIVASSRDIINNDKGDVWDSGDVESPNSVCVRYNGKQPLEPGRVYYWKVRITDNKGHKYEYSDPKGFITAQDMDGYTSVLPLEKIKQHPVALRKIGSSLLADFGKAAFSKLLLRLNSFTGQSNSVTLHIGESLYEGIIDDMPDGKIRYRKYEVDLNKGYNRYSVDFEPDPMNTDPNLNGGALPVLMPEYIGEVYPFRYVQLDDYYGPVLYNNITREVVQYPFNDGASSFECSDTVLNQVWDLCKHTIKATTFAGTYVDGDRERITYEGDVIINQLSHYATDYQYSIARNSLERLMAHPTWPTEWILGTMIIAYNDYLYTGDASFLEKYYEDLKLRTLWRFRDPDDYLLHSGENITEPYLLQSLRTHSPFLKDLIDWPASEQDNYAIDECNASVNAFLYKSLSIFAQIADIVGNKHDAKHFSKMAAQTHKTFNQLFMTDSCLYKDNLEGDHKSLHANMYPLVFGMVNDTCLQTVTDFVQQRKMACSVMGAQFLLEALYDNDMAEYATSLMSDTSSRSWYEMIRRGSTMTTEAWNKEIKSNEDWSHAWGTAPANIITRKLMGIEPVEPGFAKVRIKPQTQGLDYASITTPTPRGPISVSIVNNGEGSSSATIVIPPNMTADVELPNRKTETIGSGTWQYKY